MMNSHEIIKHLSERLGKSQREIRWLLKHCTEVFRKTLDVDFSFTIPKLGTFRTQLRRKRRAYNPHYKKFVMLPPKRAVFFYPSSVLKNRVKNQKDGNGQ